MKETLTEDDLDKVVNLTLTETETIWLLDMPGTSVSNEAEEAAKIKKRNEEYQEVCWFFGAVCNSINVAVVHYYFILFLIKARGEYVNIQII